MTPLMKIIKYNFTHDDPSLVRLFLELGADPTISRDELYGWKRKMKMTAIDYAIEHPINHPLYERNKEIRDILTNYDTSYVLK